MTVDQLIVLLKKEMSSDAQSLYISSELHKALFDITDEVVPFDWVSWDEGREAITGRDFSKLTRYEHLQLFVALIRNDCFCEGALSSALGSGLLLDIAQSMQQLEQPSN
ncbi:MAG: hypothetical protein DSY85_08555 [Marinomonas sp.]|nr:MAG: hypothetical protein DSY85_08555 [Marinomonas sp.]